MVFVVVQPVVVGRRSGGFSGVDLAKALSEASNRWKRSTLLWSVAGTDGSLVRDLRAEGMRGKPWAATAAVVGQQTVVRDAVRVEEGRARPQNCVSVSVRSSVRISE